jgi:hypothetical protein
MEIGTSLSPAQWLALAACALLSGMGKTGIAGVHSLIVPWLAAAFGGRFSTGVLLPILILSDFFAIAYYRRDADWRAIARLLPWALLGIGLGAWLGRGLPDEAFKRWMALSVLAGLLILLWSDRRKNAAPPSHPLFAASLGLLGGFATMIGNVAGPILSVYLLAMRLPKDRFIGTGAWFFFIVNLSKAPFQVLGWGNIPQEILIADLLMLPAIALGAWLGFRIVKRFPERAYRLFSIAATALAVLLLLF